MAIISNATTIADAGAFSVSLGSMVHIKTLTASNDSTLAFIHGTDDVVLDDTYPIYILKIINLFSHTDDRAVLLNFTIVLILMSLKPLLFLEQGTMNQVHIMN